jgi:hypothetical protein
LASVKLSSKARSDLQAFCREQNPQLSTTLGSGGSEAEVLVLDSELAQSIPQSELLTHFHPLVQWITDCHSKNAKAFVPTSAVELQSGLFPGGDYVIAVQFWTFHGIKKSKRIEFEIAPLRNFDSPESFDCEKIPQN